MTLQIMHELAMGPGAHEKLGLAPLTDRRFAAYRVPPPLVRLGQHFLARAQALDGSRTRHVLACPTPADTRWLRNHYLHRSAKQDGDGDLADTVGMEARADYYAGRIHTERLIIPDDDPNFTPPALRGAAERASGFHGY